MRPSPCGRVSVMRDRHRSKASGNLAQLRRFLARMARHKVRWSLVAVTLILTGCDWALRPVGDAYSLVAAILHCAAIVLTGMFPRIGSLGVFFVELMCCFTQTIGGPSRLWGDCLSVGILSNIEGTISVVVLSTAGYGLLQIAETILLGSIVQTRLTPASSVFLVSVMLVSALLGYTFRRITDARQASEQRHQHVLRKLEYEQQEQRLQVAARMHDFVADKLANIIMQTETDSLSTPDARRSVHDEAYAALNELHAIIDMMQHPDEDAGSATTAVKRQLTDICTEQDRRMAAMGLHGKSIVRDWGISIETAPDRIPLAIDFLNEIYANIGKYADSDVPYHLNIALYDGRLEIVQSNRTIGRRTSTVGGKGLSIYAQRISHIHGVLSYEEHHGEWSCYH